MLVLALVAWLAASAPDPTPIPGTRLRLGMTESQMQGLGQFADTTASDAAGATALRGDVKFFGVPCRATLYVRDGRLERAHFAANDVSPHAVDYVEGQMRRAKLWRECTRLEPGDRVCDWLGAVRIHLEIKGSRLHARVEAPLRPWEAEADSVPAAPPVASASPAPARTSGEHPAAASPAPATRAAASPPAPPPTSAPAPPPPSASPSASPAAAKPATPESATPEPATPAPSAAAADRAAQPVATLAETLRISLPERNAPSEWPRMTSTPKLEYPDAARRESVQGIVWVKALVDTDGGVRSAEVDRGIRELNDAALAWVSKSRFAPCIRDGRPCRFWVRVAVRFTLY